MIAIEIVLAVVGVGLCVVIATMLVLIRRYQRQERAWDAQLQTTHEMTTTARREMAVVMASMTAAQAEAMVAQVEISVARSRVVAAEEARMLAIAMAEAAPAEAAVARSPVKSASKAVKAKKVRAIPKPATPCSCS